MRSLALSLALAVAAPIGPQWPCEVTVTIEDGPRRAAAEVAVAQLDAATIISWPVVEDGMIMITWGDLEAPVQAVASVAATDSEKVGGEVTVDPDVGNRWVMYTLLHELGHVAGLDHNSEVSVMGGGDVPFRKFTAWDLDALADVPCGG